MKKHKITIGKNAYTLVEASAYDQRELVTIVGRPAAFHKASSELSTIDTELLFGLLMTMNNDTIEKIDGLVLGDVTDKDGVMVDLKTFQSRMADYYQLLAQAIKANLEDFFDYLPSGKSASAGQK